MRLWPFGVILLGFALIITVGGCVSDKLAEEIAAQRKAGDAAGARQKALATLTDKANQAEIWRELAFCDEALYRDPGSDEDARQRMLVEAALLCAGVCGRNNGTPPDPRWGAICTLVAGHLQTCRKYTLDIVKLRPAERREPPIRNLQEWREHLAEINDPLYLPESPHVEYMYEVEPAEAQAAVYRYACLQSLAWRLPHTTRAETASREVVMDDVRRWAESRNLSASLILSGYEAGEQVVTTAYTRTVEDLQDPGNFQVSTIVNNGILER